LVNRLVFENLKHRPIRTLLSALAIGVQVTLMLTLVGVSRGMLDDAAEHSRGTGADILIRPPGASILGFSQGTMPEGIVALVRKRPHVALAAGVLMQSVSRVLTSIAGINLDEFDAMSGGFKYLEGGPFHAPDEMIVDDVEARASHLHVGSMVDFGIKWRVTGVVESGKLSRMFTDLKSLQEKYSVTNKISLILVKVDDPANTQAVIDSFKSEDAWKEYGIYSVQEYASLVSTSNIPLLEQFTGVVIGIGVAIGFLVVFLSMYTAVLERTREIGILKALGASPGYIMGILLRETIVLGIVGVIAGIAMTYGSRALLHAFAPAFITEIVYSWWPRAAMIALGAALVGAIYPGMKAAKQDAIEALSYD
jgi:putative ABC transport system permease protein